MGEDRVTPRHRVLKAGTIEFGGGAIDCTIRNMSNTGVALEVASPVGIRRRSPWFCQQTDRRCSATLRGHPKRD